MSAAQPGARRRWRLTSGGRPGNGLPLGGGYVRRGPAGLTPPEQAQERRSADRRAHPRGFARANHTTTVGNASES